MTTASAQGAHALDSLDHRIVDALRHDGRVSFKELANQLGANEATLRARVKRLEESGAVRVVAVTDYEAAGYTMMLAVGVTVEGRNAAEVAADLAQIPEVFSVCEVVGGPDIETLVVAHDQAGLNTLLTKTLAGVPGVRKLLPAHAVDVLKNQPDWVPF